MTHITEDDLVLHYYGEMDAAEEAHATAHLETCAACRASYTSLQRVLAVVEAEPVPDPHGSFERTVWARLQPEIAPRRAWFSVFTPVRLGFAAAVIVLVAGAFVAGQRWQRQVATTQASAADAAMRERVLLVDLGEHLDRSQAVLVELASADGSGTVDITPERTRAEQLVASNRLYRQAAETNGDAAVTELLDELERILVDVAASPGELSAADMERVRQRIEDAGLLFKVRIVSAEVRERQKQALRARAGQSS